MVFSGNGNGTFKAPGNPAATRSCWTPWRAVTSTAIASSTSCIRRPGPPTWRAAGERAGGFANKVDYTVGTNPQSVAVADFNGDGKLDVVTANFGCNPCTDPI
jgi:hypothetical protein